MNSRLFFACLLAVSVGLSTSIISISRGVVYIVCIWLLLWPRRSLSSDVAVQGLRTPRAVLLAVAVMALTLLWTTAPLPQGLIAFAKHGKLIAIPLLVVLVRNRREAIIVLGAFVGTQIFLLLSSWLLVLKLPVPWATSREALTDYAVFSGYLDQSIMSAVLAAICWHLRGLAPRGWGKPVGAVVIVLALLTTLMVMQGRTGHVVAIALLSLAISWELPRRLRYAAVLVPFLVVSVMLAGSDTVRERATQAASEAVDYMTHANNQTSSGERLNYWRRSVQAIAERPLIGFGVGSFNAQYKRIDGGEGNAQTFTARNPHQEFLLWGVEAGIGGMLVLLNMLLCLYRDATRMERQVSRAIQSVGLALVIACMFNSTLFDAAIGDFFCVTLGLLLALGVRSPERSPQPQLRSTSLGVA